MMAGNSFLPLGSINIFQRWRPLGVALDDKKIMSRVRRARRGVLTRQGGLVRTIAKRSMKKRKKASPPGQPPSVKKGTLKRMIEFAYDETKGTVVVGAVIFPGSKVPDLLEFGGFSKRTGNG